MNEGSLLGVMVGDIEGGVVGREDGGAVTGDTEGGVEGVEVEGALVGPRVGREDGTFDGACVGSRHRHGTGGVMAMQCRVKIVIPEAWNVAWSTGVRSHVDWGRRLLQYSL